MMLTAGMPVGTAGATKQYIFIGILIYLNYTFWGQPNNKRPLTPEANHPPNNDGHAN